MILEKPYLFIRSILVVFGSLALLLAVPAASQAQAAFDVCKGTEASATEFCTQALNGDNSQGAGIFGPNSIVTRVVETIVFVSASVAVLMIVIGGFRYVLSQGDPQATQNAKNTIIYAIVGLVIAISAQVILSLVLSRI